MSEATRNRDKKIANKQKRLAACVAGVSSVISNLISYEMIDPEVLQPIRDAGRLMTPLHSDITNWWKDVVRLGLSQDECKKLVEKYPPSGREPGATGWAEIQEVFLLCNSGTKANEPILFMCEGVSPDRSSAKAQQKFITEKINLKVSSPAGRLASFYETWKQITADPLLLSWIQDYRIPFASTPWQSSAPNNRAFSNRENEAMLKLLP